MPNKNNKMEDMKFKGVKITSISRKDIHIENKPSQRPLEAPKSIPQDTFIETNIHIHERERDRKIPSAPSVVRKPKRIRRPILILLLVCLFFGGAYWYGHTFQNAKITITQKHQALAPDQEVWTASKEVTSSIPFEIMIIPETEMREITLTESRTGSTKAKGEITLYNEYSTTAQTISINSMMSDSNGKTYRTDSRITIPGYKTVNGKITPGQVDVGITAFLSGDSYNGNPTDLTFNGFKNTTKFKKIYGKAKTPMTGGSEGLTYFLNTEDKGKLDAHASSTFKNNLLKKVTAQVPAGYILYPNAYTYTYNVDQTATSKTPNAKIPINGTLSAVLISKKHLSDALIKKMLPSIKAEEQKEIEIVGLENLAFNFVNANEAITKDKEQIQFKLKGNLDAVWHPDANALKTNLMGIHKSKVQDIFKKDPGILNANVKLFPSWQKYLPSDISKLHVVIL